MNKKWGLAWRYLKPWLAQLVWLDPAAAAAYISPQPLPPIFRPRRLEPRKERRVA